MPRPPVPLPAKGLIPTWAASVLGINDRSFSRLLFHNRKVSKGLRVTFSSPRLSDAKAHRSFAGPGIADA
jgi:hypothetical protein